MNYGKFNSAEELLKSYQNLQAAFTRRCQYIKLLRERAQNAGLDIPPLAKEGENEGDVLPQDTQMPVEQLNTANTRNKEENMAKQGASNSGEKTDGEQKIINAVKDAKGISAQEVLNTAAKNTDESKGSAEQTQNNFEEKEQTKVLPDGLKQKKSEGQKVMSACVIENSLCNAHFGDAAKEQGQKAIENPLNISLLEVIDGKDISGTQEKNEVLRDQKLKEQTCGEAGQNQNDAEEALIKNKFEELRQGEETPDNSLKKKTQNALNNSLNTLLDNALNEEKAQNALNNSLSAPLNNALNEERAHSQKVFTQEGGISAQSPPPTEEEFYAKYPFANHLKLKTYLGEGEKSLCVVTPFEKALLAALGDAQSLYQAMANDEQYLESLLDTNRKLYEKALNRYAAACARSTPPVIGKGNAYPSVPPQKPKTLEEARGLIKHYIK